jgi:DNA-binding NarL/FixJ family response regulator
MSLNSNQEEKIVKTSQTASDICRVYVVDRDSMSGDLLANALVNHRNFDASSVRSCDLLAMLVTSEVDLVVIAADLDFRSDTGFELAQSVSSSYPEIPIVVLLSQFARESVLNAFRSGARGVFSRQEPMSEFLDCVEHVRRGYIWAGKQETNSLLDVLKNLPSTNLVTGQSSSTLTSRELEVVRCAAKGKTNKAIAVELGLSEHTVKNYLFRAFEKLGVSSRVELLFYLTLQGHIFEPR